MTARSWALPAVWFRTGPAAVLAKGAALAGAALWTFGAVALAAAGAGDCGAGPWMPLKAATAIDARTIMLGDGSEVRLAGIDSLAALARDRQTAETMDDRLAGQLAQWLATMPLRIRILPGKPDRHGRRAALILADGELLQKRIMDAGLAVFMPGDVFGGTSNRPDNAGRDCARKLLAAEAAARLARRGGWSDRKLGVVSARPDVLSSQFGHFVIFQGIARSVGTRRDRTYIDFGDHWRTDVTVEIAAARRKHFGGEAALEDLAGSTLRVRGFLEEKAGPMISARYPAQIEVLPDGVAERQRIWLR